MRRLRTAVAFLTVLPVARRGEREETDLAASVPFFPVVGLLAGAFMWALASGLQLIFPAPVSSALVALTLVAISGGLHLDGLSDTADGFLSARPREEVLRIMKDSHVGAMGVIAIAGTLATKITALRSLGEATFPQAAFLMPLAGRCGLVFALAILPAARADGLGSRFCGKCSTAVLVWALVVLLGGGWVAASWAGLAAAAIVLAATLAFAAWAYRKIGGATGDTLGATCEIAEMVAVLALTAKPLARLGG